MRLESRDEVGSPNKCAVILFTLQKPLHGHGPLSKSLYLRILRHATIRIVLDIMWITGLILCGPFRYASLCFSTSRFILLYEHGDIAMIALLGTLFIKSISSAKSRGTLSFIVGVVSIVFFDHDVKDSVSDHPEGVHKSLLIHRIYEFFIHLGLSDHKTGAILLLITACAEAGFNSAARSLAASIGGAKRLHTLSTCTSVGVTLVLMVAAAFLGTIFIHSEPPQLDIPVSEFSFFYSFSATALVVLVFVADFYFSEFMVKKMGPHSPQKVSYPCLVLTAFLISAFINGSVASTVGGHVDTIMPESPSARPVHHLSTGAIISLMAFLYASTLLNRANSENGGGPFYNSRRFVGFSPAGLPLYTPQVTPSSVGGGEGEGLSLAYHAVATLRQVSADRASFRMFVFLCLNLSFTFIELFYGVWTNSLGLISDGFHMLFDCAALVMGLYASVVGRWKPTRIYSYGFHRAEILSGFINSLALMVVSTSIFLNALKRIHQPPDISTDRLMAVSIGGLLVNLVGIFALGHAHSHGSSGSGGGHGHSHSRGCHGHSHGSHSHSHGSGSGKGAVEAKVVVLPCSNGFSDAHDAFPLEQEDASGDSNLRGVYLHVLADTLGSVGVIISSFFVTNYGWNIADPICSLFISGAIMYSALPLVKDTLLVLGLRAPPKHHPANPNRILQKVLQVDSVLEVVNPCIWQNTENTVCCSMRLRIASEATEILVLAQVKEVLKMDQISHLTIQLEKDDFYRHMEALDLHLDTIGRHTRSSLADLLNNQHCHHSQDPVVVTTHSGDSSGVGGWTTVNF
ncbi:Zinc transporter 5 [Taenia crassiceps]|uniref:Proton-coupled zinc antiporter SLC30A5 n=1 Tax=Taenia crassiceps TaxID=6207 RepID=A0ABR4QJE0_9CEST